MTDHIGLVYVKNETGYHDQLDEVRLVIKHKQDNDVIDRTGTVYVENDTELSWPIKSGIDCDKKQIG